MPSEFKSLRPIVLGMLGHLRRLEPPTEYQSDHTIKGSEHGLGYDIRVKTDLEWSDLIVDLKATMKCPTAIGIFQRKAVRQQALYSKLRGKPVRLLYASPSRSFAYDLSEDDVEGGFAELMASFRAIEAMAERCPTPQEAMRLVPFAAEHWFDEDEMKRARNAWINGGDNA